MSTLFEKKFSFYVFTVLCGTGAYKSRTPLPWGRPAGCGFFMMKEKEDSALALVCAEGDALDVELLHDDEQDGDGDGVEEALADQVAQTGRACVDHDKTRIGVGQVEILQHEVDRDHGQYAREQVDNDREVLQQLATLEPAAAQRVDHHQHKAGEDHAVEAGHHKGVGKPARELRHRVRVEQDVDVVAYGVACREEPPHIDAPVGGKGGDQQVHLFGAGGCQCLILCDVNVLRKQIRRRKRW